MTNDELATFVNEQAAAESLDDSGGAWGNELLAGKCPVRWLWHGYLAAGHVTLLTSQWKSGKTTLVSVLLSHMRQGGRLGGMDVQPARAIVISEETREQWHLRHERFDLSHVYFICRPFKGRPSAGQWQDLLGRVARLAGTAAARLVVVDTLASFLPARTESLAIPLTDALFPLQELTGQGLAVLLLHHPRKGESAPGQAARGSGALPAFVDIILEMNWCVRAGNDDRRRRILAFSRSDFTPCQCVLELNADGTDYLTHGTFQDDEFSANWGMLRMVLEDAADKRTRRQLLDEWPADFLRPEESTLWHWLQRAVKLGLVIQEGTGRRNDPFRFFLPEREAVWRQDPLRMLERQFEESQHIVLAELENYKKGRTLQANERRGVSPM